MTGSASARQESGARPPWRRHDGSPGQGDADYFVPPDSAIGTVISAETNRGRAGYYQVDPALRRRMIEASSVALVVGGLLGALMVHASDPTDLLPWSSASSVTQKAAVYGLAFIGAIVVFGVMWILRSGRSSYVGQRGLQRHTKPVFGRPKTEVMRFADSSRLQVARTRHLLNGAYASTAYEYRWVDAKGAATFVIAGNYDERIPFKPSEPFLFALAAERAWLATQPSA